MESNNSEKIIMVIPGASAQIPLIESLHKNGFKVLCVNPFEDSPAFKYSDYTERYDILNVDSCIKIAKKYKVIAVMSDECDIAMPTVAAVSEKLGLKSIGSHFAELYTNKRAMRDFSVISGFPCPAYRQCATIGEAKEFFQSLTIRKMIIKPLDSNSSRGVFTIESIEQLDKVFNDSLSFSKISNAVLCEEYIEGTEFTIDGIMLKGRHYSLAISKKKHYQHHPNIACELYFSHCDDEFDYELLKNQNNEYVEKSGLPFGFTHAEYKYDGEKFVLIEIGARGGGNYISSHIVPAMTGIDNYKILINSTLRKTIDDSIAIDNKYLDRCCVLKFFDIDIENDGKTLCKIEGKEILQKSSNILLYDFKVKEGETVTIADNDSKRIGFYIAYGDTKQELDAFIQLIENIIKFIF